MSLTFYIRYAVRSLRRGGQRTLLAMLCIAFGVTTLIALQTPAALLNRALARDSSASLGGDLEIKRGLAPLTSEEIARLEQLRAEGVIRAYTLVANGGRLGTFAGEGLIGPSYMRFQPLIQVSNSGQTTQLYKSLGVDPQAYPLAGDVTLRDGVSLANALKEDGSAVITADLANRLKLQVGDTVRLIGQPGVAPMSLRVTGIVTSYPDGSSSSMLYSLATARLIAGRDNVATGALVLNATNGNTQQRLEAEGWSVVTPEQRLASARSGATLVNIMFKGAGMLGLIIGSYGVLNTLQVLLARRTLEIAMLKTLGYRRRDLLALFGIETMLLGMAGALLGGLVAILPSMMVTTFFSRVAPFLVVWQPDPRVFGTGMLAGLAATVAAGVYAIVRASNVRPVMLLRDLPGAIGIGRRLQSIMLGLMMLAVFGAISSVTMGSPLVGTGVIVAAAVFLGLLSIVFTIVLSVVVRLPLPGGRISSLAQGNLKRQKRRAVSALIALFLGVFTIGVSASAIGGTQAQNSAGQTQTNSDSLIVYTAEGNSKQVEEQLGQQGIQIERTISETPIKAQTGDIPLPWAGVLQGHDRPPSLKLSGAAWGSNPDGVYVSQAGASLTSSQPGGQIKAGTTLTITTNNGQEHTVRVVGFYQQPSGTSAVELTQGILASKNLVERLVVVPATKLVVGVVPQEQHADMKAALVQAVPTATTLSGNDLDARSQQFAGNLLWLTVSVAGLALVAGAVLIANAVGLAMLERQKEIGIFKAVGFSSRHVLQTILIEHGLLGLLGGIVGTAAVGAVVMYYNTAWPSSPITFQPQLALVLVGIAITITIGSAAVVAWQPTRVRPLGVLRQE